MPKSPLPMNPVPKPVPKLIHPWDLVPCPANSAINTGYTSAHPDFMLKKFGKPGPLTEDCSEVTNRVLLSQFKTVKVGQITLYGLGPVVDKMTYALLDFKKAHPAEFTFMRSAGMTCCRHVRGVPGSYSNHSWGTAIDLYFGESNDTVGDGKCQAGMLLFSFYAHKYGFYWGSEFSSVSKSREDSMHHEASTELIERLYPHGI